LNFIPSKLIPYWIDLSRPLRASGNPRFGVFDPQKSDYDRMNTFSLWGDSSGKFYEYADHQKSMGSSDLNLYYEIPLPENASNERVMSIYYVSDDTQPILAQAPKGNALVKNPEMPELSDVYYDISSTGHVQSLQNLFSIVEKEYACVSNLGQETVFFWDEAKMRNIFNSNS
jgi:hypothetical protein